MKLQIRQGDASRAKRDRTIKHIQTHWIPRIILILMCLVFILPFYWMIALALKSNAELTIYPPTLWPHDPQWGNFRESTEVFPFWRFAPQHLDRYGPYDHWRGDLEPDHRLRVLAHRVAGPRQGLPGRAGHRLHAVPGDHRRPGRHLRAARLDQHLPAAGRADVLWLRRSGSS